MLSLSYFLSLKAEALHLADRTSEALEAIKEAEAVMQRNEECHALASLHLLRGALLALIATDETQIEASFREAIRIAKEQKKVSASVSRDMDVDYRLAD
jgi:hypothetical protein